MAPLFSTTTIDLEKVRAAVADSWGLTLGKLLKAQQNHTFEATDSEGKRFAVRATPDTDGSLHPHILDELRFVHFLAHDAKVPGVCHPVPPADGKASPEPGSLAVRDGTTTIAVFTWAQGSPVNFMAYKWMQDTKLLTAWGAWLARCHEGARSFASAHPDVYARMRGWDEIQEGIVKGSKLHPDDERVWLEDAGGSSSSSSSGSAGAGSGQFFCLTHGDANISNFYFDEASDPPQVWMFDWEQVQRAWPEYDIAQASLTCVMLHEGGSLPSGDPPVPEAVPDRFLEEMVAGYEGVSGKGSVNRDRLARMVQLRKQFYANFSARAKAEGNVPPSLGWFLAYVDRWLERAPPKEAV
jgi:Ser/Thr protein kinase RdoA (MazF antagonist)